LVTASAWRNGYSTDYYLVALQDGQKNTTIARSCKNVKGTRCGSGEINPMIVEVSRI